jgi:DNA polymerase (family 10)
VEIARALRELALRLEMEDVPFRPRAYEKAALAVESTRTPLATTLGAAGDAGLDALPSVGKGIAKRIAEFLRMSREEMTRRWVRAVEHAQVDGLFHPSARLIGSREPIDFDLAAVIRAAARSGAVLEIDALPDRLDLRDESAREPIRAGVKLAVDSDAHGTEPLRYARELGTGAARRAWATRSDVVSAWPLERCLAQLKRHRRERHARCAPGASRAAHP